jgi:hypothetical protein
VRGSFRLAFRQFEDDSLSDRSFSETGGHLSLKMLEMGGTGWNLRSRLRSRNIDRDRDWSTRNPRSESDDRLYELQAVWAPQSGVATVQLGRLGANPFVPLGYLDGALGQFRLGNSNYLGAFAGRESVVEELGFENEGEKYGAFYRFATPTPGPRMYAEVTVAAIGEYRDGDPSREYASLETRLRSGGKWHFFQRAEVDVNRDWREQITGDSSQLTNLSLSSSYMATRSTRLVASYDQFQNYRNADNRYTPEDLFNDYLRQGLRAGVYVNGRKLGGSVLLGMRDQEGDEDATYSFAGSVRYAPLRRVSFNGHVSVYSGEVSDGLLATLDVRRSFKGGHDVGLLYGYSSSDLTTGDEERSNDWLRLGGRLQLPARFFASAEIETLSGDDQEGNRLYLDLGYRF